MNHVIFKVEFKKINRSLKIKGRERLTRKLIVRLVTIFEHKI